MPDSVRTVISLVFLSSCLWAQDPFQIHGYVQGRFTDQEGTPDRLELRRARVMVSGDPLSELSYTVQVDLVKRPYLMDAALTWKVSRGLRVTAGQFKIPFSAESLISDNLNVPIARARAVNGLAPGRDTGVQARDTGVQLAGSWQRGKRPLVEYTAGVFRGQTLVESPGTHDRATAGRVLAHPIAGLTLGADGYASFSAPAHAEKRRWEGEGSYERGPLRLRAEQIWARDGSLDRRGGYGLGAWRLSPHWEPLARADWLTANTAKANTTSIAYLAGLNFYWGKHVKIGSNAGAQHDQGPKGLSPLFLAQTMIGF
ncbi:MAG: OprO/OprP family phosphate-selective porin [Acidobacteriia bacterium]|nr:OprO/OprP family phosphate-selective porin [Terriglobia bacterium]